MSTTRPPAADQAPGSVEASRRGAHRARAKPALAGLPIIVGVLIVLAAVGGAWYVLGDTTKDSSPSVQAAVTDAEPSGTQPASAGGSEASPSAEASPTRKVTQAPAEETTTGTSTQVDRGISIRVLNSVSVQGLAARVSGDLKQASWTTITGTGNSIQKGLATTKVYYGGKATRATAQALVKDLGYGTIVADQSVAKDGLVVVLGQDAV